MRIYIVGGYIRDTLLGLEPKDRDFVVVGSSPEEMLSLGFSQVGKDFPVFLHPRTGDEIALARTERKVGKGYDGFETNWKGVTLEEDLYRRDLTINALAREVDGFINPKFIGDTIDPYGGVEDLKEPSGLVLRPVSEAFLEDPTRVLRAARFYSRYKEVTLHWSLIDAMLAGAKELQYITPERVWSETQKALTEAQPAEYFRLVLALHGTRNSQMGGFFEELWRLKSVNGKNDYHQESHALEHTYMVVEKAKELFDDPEIIFAGLVHDLGKSVTWEKYKNCHGHEDAGVPLVEDFCKKYKVPNNYRDLALITTKQHLKVHGVLGRGGNKMSKAKSVMKLFEQTSALSKPERFLKMLKVCEADAAGRIGIAAKEEYIQRPYLEECLQAVLDFKTKDLSKQLLSEGKSGIVIGQKIREERIRVIRQVQNKWKERLNVQ